MSNDNDPHTAPTRPAQRVPDGYAHTEREPLVQTKQQAEEAEQLNKLRTEHPGAPAWGLTILVRTNSTAKAVERLEQRADDHEKRLGVLERPARGPMQSYSDIHDDEAVSGSVLRAAMQKQNTDQRRATNTQTAAIIGALIALATAGASWLNAQTEHTRADTAAAARTAATEAVREAAPVVKEAAREAVKESKKEDQP